MAEPTPDDLAATARDLLRRNRYPQVQRLAVAVRDGEVVLTGRVMSYHLKQIAQQVLIAENIPVNNQVQVADPS